MSTHQKQGTNMEKHACFPPPLAIRELLLQSTELLLQASYGAPASGYPPQYPPGAVRPGVYGGQVQMGMAAGGYPMIPGAIGVVKHGKLKMKGELCGLDACV
jgi:hypothetical protein